MWRKVYQALRVNPIIKREGDREGGKEEEEEKGKRGGRRGVRGMGEKERENKLSSQRRPEYLP
jgi:hypothetical protein